MDAWLSIRRRCFTLSNTGLGSGNKCFAELGSVWKAADVKIIFWFLTQKAVALASAREVPVLAQSAACAWCFQRGLWYLDQHDLILPQKHATKFHDLLMKGLLHWQGLATRCIQNNVFRWKLRPKHHTVDHLARDVKRTRLNPRLLMQCFQDESYLGQIKQIGIHCHVAQMMTRFFQRLLIFLAIRFKDSAEACK